MKFRVLISLVALFGLASPSFAQSAKRKVRNSKQQPVAATNESSGVLPDWPVSDFDWFINPIVGLQYTTTSVDGSPAHRSTTMEGGLGAGLSGIPVVPSNPGFTLAPDAGLAYGYNLDLYKDEKNKEQRLSTHYRRQWIGLGATTYFHFFRYHLDIRNARLTPSEDPSALVQSQKIGNDFGILILPWLSEHYTLDYIRAYAKYYGDKLLEDYDHWLHTRMFFSPMSFVLDLGPGVTHTIEYRAGGEGVTEYFLLKTGFNPFWKFVADGQAKYVYHSTEETLGAYANLRLPEDQLNEPQTLALPEDSFLGSLFLGVKDIAYGIGAGWRQNIQVLNVQRRHSARKETKKDQGLGLYYEVRF